MIEMNETNANEMKEDFETLLSLLVEVKKNNTDEFMVYFMERIDELVSKYFEGGD